MAEKTVDLKYPILIKTEDGGPVTVNQLHLGRLKARHLRLLPADFSERGGKLEPSQILPLIAGLAGISVDAADELDFEDVTKIAAEIGSFLSESLTTGKE